MCARRPTCRGARGHEGDLILIRLLGRGDRSGYYLRSRSRSRIHENRVLCSTVHWHAATHDRTRCERCGLDILFCLPGLSPARCCRPCIRSDLRRSATVLARSNHAPFSSPFILAALVWLRELTTCSHLLDCETHRQRLRVRDASTEVLSR